MILFATNKSSAINQLSSFSQSLNGGRVNKKLYSVIYNLYVFLKNETTEDVRYIELEEHEIDTILTEYLSSITMKQNMVACVYLGRRSSVYVKKRIENALKNMSVVYTFPTAHATAKIIILISFIKEGYNSELYDIDFAANMLRYYD